MKGATWDGCIGDILRVVSIHAPNEGSDGKLEEAQAMILQVSIHAPNEGSDNLNNNGRRFAS